MAFEKGKSGNPGGRPKEKPFADALRMELAAAGDDSKALRTIARNLIALASKADEKALPAIREIADRMDGKPAQSVDMTVRKQIAKELTDDELADIAAGSSEGTAETAPSSSQLN